MSGLSGPIVTTIRALLTPQPMKELRVKGEYVHHKTVKAAMGVKISANGLDNAVAGTQLLVANNCTVAPCPCAAHVFEHAADTLATQRDELDDLKDEVQSDLATILSRIDKSGQGVSVQASTLGSLEALLQFLEEMKIPVSGLNIGPVHKKDVMRASIMVEHRPEYAVILAFDVKVAPEAVDEAKKLGVRIFTADIIYHLFDACTKYMEEVRRQKQENSKDSVRERAPRSLSAS